MSLKYTDPQRMQITKETQFKKLIVHIVGNKQKEEPLKLSQSCTSLSPDFSETLLNFFLSSFSTDDTFHFSDVISSTKVLPKKIAKIFESQAEFERDSQDIAQFLYDSCNQPNIKKGELYVTYIEHLRYGDQEVNAVGIFKSEHKETYLKLKETTDGFELNREEGINPQKIDKGALIINTDAEDGYRILLIDKVKKSDTAKFWKETFLNAKLLCDDYGLTKQYMDLTRNFINDVCHAQNEIEPVQQVEIVSETLDYFNNAETFDKKEFKDKVLKPYPGKRELFDEYQKEWEKNKKVELKDQFEITDSALEKAKQRFKHVLKLDTNFHVYIHGSQKLIEKGYDAKRGKYYYKLYFDQEL
ncbi:nucleoid-associated protein [Halosquirtibacter laminarini]|uniref:Nucleoid-associated protein n=1 Tax=Halosquirtibacter laminarini TaxID=3374600 RepID=A0AC61NR84_9BACT|nr:nucleoid-associated protein [Prolixibacteraceae bacterium]